jgi:hypothetical protein
MSTAAPVEIEIFDISRDQATGEIVKMLAHIRDMQNRSDNKEEIHDCRSVFSACSRTLVKFLTKNSEQAELLDEAESQEFEQLEMIYEHLRSHEGSHSDNSPILVE